MITVKLDNGDVLEFPEPHGEDAVNALRINTWLIDNPDIPDAEFDEAVDDMIYLLLSYWKAEKVNQPFDTLGKLCHDDLLKFKSEKVGERIKARVQDAKDLIAAYTFGQAEAKNGAKELLKRRGFFGKRELSSAVLRR